MKSHSAKFRRNGGMALVIALLFLLMLTLLGVASLSTNTAEERMGYASADYTRAFQAADSAVSEGENWINTYLAVPPATCSVGSAGCLMFSPTAAPSLSSLYSANWWSTNGVSINSIPNPDGASTTTRTDVSLGRIPIGQYPLYVLQSLGRAKGGTYGTGSRPGAPISYYFRVTGSGTGVSEQMQTVTQSTYAKELTPSQ